MTDSRVIIKISHNNDIVMNENSRVDTNDLTDLIAVLKNAQQKTNDCLTRLTKETDVASPGDESDDTDEHGDSDMEIAAENENDIASKRPKLKN